MAKKSKAKKADPKKAGQSAAEKRMAELAPKSQMVGGASDLADKLEAAGKLDEAALMRGIEEAQAKAAEQAAAAANTGEGQPQMTISQVLGEISWMMSMSPTHRYFFLADLEWLVMTPVMLNQFRIYRDDNGKPAGLVLWASVSEEVEKRLESGATRLAPQDWKSGDRLWVVDVVDLMGGKAPHMLADMKKVVFQDKSFKFHSTGADGVRSVVEG
ncbi:toxin-activating lysine-acyltransferase [Aestuariispira insulae]|uniref:RTX toxin-activating lysine-acyltransferase n=1 Tax=Aestuariispira insulae TaxID=1461337 RepID=A0A3D9H1D0_9PROT|nr:toxin-activating lysine-acyltransferase [Aestuariispira insulae]RED43329.1 hemolysin-activating ACP:hemolysin acyltransferase [Aestuariispira insulae]